MRYSKPTRYAVAATILIVTAFRSEAQTVKDSGKTEPKPSASPTKRVAVLAPEANAVLQPKLRARLESLEDRARKVVGQQLSDGRFLLNIKGQVSADKFLRMAQSKLRNTRLTTLPVNITANEKQKLVAEGLSIEEVALVSGPISISLTFDTDVPNAQADALKEAVSEAIGIDPAKGDTIIIKKAPLTAPGTNTKIETLNTKIAEGSKDVEKLRHEISLAQQKISQVEAERLKLQTDLKTAQDKISASDELLKEEKEKTKRMEEDLSIYKTPLGEVKKLIKGLELPLTILPIALLLFIFVAVGFFIYLRFQGTKTGKMMQAAEVMAQAFAKAGRSNSPQGLTLDAARSEFAKLTANQNEEASRQLPGQVHQALLGEELATARQEALDAWVDLKKYPYLTFAQLREWLVGRGSQTQRFIALVNALGPVESMRLLQQFAHEDLALMKGDSIESAHKLPGYAAILQLHRNVTAEVIRNPQCIAELDFPDLIRASDDALAEALTTCNPTGIALCVNLLPPSRSIKVMEALPTERQGDCVSGSAALANLSGKDLEEQIRTLKMGLAPKLSSLGAPKLSVEKNISLLLKESSPKTRAALQDELTKHTALRETVTQKMVTFDDFLDAEDETLAELLDELEAEQIAILVCALQQTAQQRVAKVLSRKVVIGVQNEIRRINSRQATLRRAQTQSLEIQAALTERLKVLVDEGVVELKRREKMSSPASQVEEPRALQANGRDTSEDIT
jgi:flagellar motor switch protein FliG